MLRERREVIKKEIDQSLAREACPHTVKAALGDALVEHEEYCIEDIRRDEKNSDPLGLLNKTRHHLFAVIAEQEVAADHEEEGHGGLAVSDEDLSCFAGEGDVDGNNKECHYNPHDVYRVYAAGVFSGEGGSTLAAVNERDDMSVEAIDYRGKTDGTEDRENYVDTGGRDVCEASVEAVQEHGVDKVKLKRDLPQEVEHTVAESYLHHDKKYEADEHEDPGQLEPEAAHLIEVAVIFARDLAPVRIHLEHVSRLDPEDCNKSREYGDEDPICLASEHTKTLCMLREDDAHYEKK